MFDIYNLFIIIFDRGYPSIEFVHFLEENNIKNLFRLSSNDYKKERELMIKMDESVRLIHTPARLEKWITDITYIHKIKDGWFYLASVMDLYSRKTIGYAMFKSIDTVLALQAVKNAINLQKPTKLLILHSDLGCQYTSAAFKDYIDSTKLITHSFSGKGCPYDNTCIKSFHDPLKKEEVHLVKYFDYDAARLSIFEYIEAWYNRKRIHI